MLTKNIKWDVQRVVDEYLVIVFLGRPYVGEVFLGQRASNGTSVLDNLVRLGQNFSPGLEVVHGKALAVVAVLDEGRLHNDPLVPVSLLDIVIIPGRVEALAVDSVVLVHGVLLVP